MMSTFGIHVHVHVGVWRILLTVSLVDGSASLLFSSGKVDESKTTPRTLDCWCEGTRYPNDFKYTKDEETKKKYKFLYIFNYI